MTETTPTTPAPDRPSRPLDAGGWAGHDPTAKDMSGAMDIVRRAGSVCWAVVGIVVVLTIVTAVLASVSEVVLPFVFAAVLAVVFTPMANALTRRGVKRSLAATAVVLFLVAIAIATILLAANAVVDQLDTWSSHVDRALDELEPISHHIGLDKPDLERFREAIAGAAALIAGGFVTLLVSGAGTVVGFVTGAVLGVLILYYLLKDGAALRTRVVSWCPPDTREEVDAVVGRSTRTIRAYASGRALLSAAVALIITAWSAILGLPMLGAIAIVNFVGGFVPYVGGVIGGGVAVIVALSDGGVGSAAATLVVVLVANFGIENLLEPRVLGERLQLHPLLVLVVTAIGGIVGGVVGLMLGVPLFIVGSDVIITAWRHSRGFAQRMLGAVAGRDLAAP